MRRVREVDRIREEPGGPALTVESGSRSVQFLRQRTQEARERDMGRSKIDRQIENRKDMERDTTREGEARVYRDIRGETEMQRWGERYQERKKQYK